MTPEERWEMLDKTTPMPPGIKALPFDRRGLPIPHIVWRNDETGEPKFTVNDFSVVVSDCIGKGKCSICGQPLPDDDVWFIGGPKSAYHPLGSYFDPPVHKMCGEWALVVCPYLALPSFHGLSNTAGAERYMARLEQEVGTLLVNHTQDSTKPNMFVLSRCNGYVALAGGGGKVFLVPNKPWREVYHWKDGKPSRKISEALQTSYREGERIGFDLGQPNFDWEAMPIHALANEGNLKGEFPWR